MHHARTRGCFVCFQISYFYALLSSSSLSFFYMLYIRRLSRSFKSLNHALFYACSNRPPPPLDDTALVTSQNFSQVIQYWEHRLSQKRPNSVPIDSVRRKMYYAELLLGTEFQEKVWELYEEIFNPKFIERIYIPPQYQNKYPALLSVQVELLMLEYRYRLIRKQRTHLEAVIKRIRKNLENVFQFELIVKDEIEAEFNHSNRLAMFHDMKSLVAKDIDMEKYIREVEEQIRCLEKSVELVDKIIESKEDEQQLRYQMSKVMALNKIARNFELLSVILIQQEQLKDAREFLQKALEIYEHVQKEMSARSIICQSRLAYTYQGEELATGLKLIRDLYAKVGAFGNSSALLLVGVYYFCISAPQGVDEQLYDKILELLDSFAIDDPVIIPKFLQIALSFAMKEKYLSSLEKHILQAVWFIENSSEVHLLDQLLQQLGSITLQLPEKVPFRKSVLRRVYECYEKTRSQFDDDYQYDHLLINALIKYEMLLEDGKTQKSALQPVLTFIEESWKDDPDLNKHLRKIEEFFKTKQINQETLEVLYKKIALAKASRNSVNELVRERSIVK